PLAADQAAGRDAAGLDVSAQGGGAAGSEDAAVGQADVPQVVDVHRSPAARESRPHDGSRIHLTTRSPAAPKREPGRARQKGRAPPGTTAPTPVSRCLAEACPTPPCPPSGQAGTVAATGATRTAPLPAPGGRRDPSPLLPPPLAAADP